jgi:hypothetical protein
LNVKHISGCLHIQGVKIWCYSPEDHNLNTPGYYNIFSVVYLTMLSVWRLYEYSMADRMINECEAVCGMRVSWGNWSTFRKPAPVPLCPLQIPEIGPGLLQWETENWHPEVPWGHETLYEIHLNMEASSVMSCKKYYCSCEYAFLNCTLMFLMR